MCAGSSLVESSGISAARLASAQALHALDQVLEKDTDIRCAWTVEGCSQRFSARLLFDLGLKHFDVGHACKWEQATVACVDVCSRYSVVSVSSLHFCVEFVFVVVVATASATTCVAAGGTVQSTLVVVLIPAASLWKHVNSLFFFALCFNILL